jgi:hypothetical protein
LARSVDRHGGRHRDASIDGITPSDGEGQRRTRAEPICALTELCLDRLRKAHIWMICMDARGEFTARGVLNLWPGRGDEPRGRARQCGWLAGEAGAGSWAARSSRIMASWPGVAGWAWQAFMRGLPEDGRRRIRSPVIGCGQLAVTALSGVRPGA